MFNKKTSIKLLITIVILFASILFIYKVSTKKSLILNVDKDKPELVYNYEGKNFTVVGQKINGDNTIHFFVPSFFDVNNLVLPDSSYLVTQGYYYNWNFSETPNDKLSSRAVLIDNNVQRYFVHILENNILSIELDEGKTIDDIHKSKEEKFDANIINIDSNGKVLFNGQLNYIKGRGNSSWGNQKKGYDLRFKNTVSLNNMGLLDKCVLVPSYFDMTGMRNKIVYNFAQDIDLAYTPESSYVNVFINNEYQGLYLLSNGVSLNKKTTKSNNAESTLITTSKNIGKLKELKYFNNNTNSKADKYLIERDINIRYVEDNSKAGFITKYDNCYVVHNSANMSFEEIYTIATKVQELEEAMYDDTSSKYLSLIDIESWVKQYLVELISNNQDSYKTSYYFYYNVSDNLMYGGPVWDYDFSLGYAKASYQYAKGMNILKFQLDNREEFMDKVKEIFNEEFNDGIIEEMFRSIEDTSNQIKNDMYLNALRYNQQEYIQSNYKTEKYDYDKSIDALKSFLNDRLNYLYNTFNSEKKYHKVDFNARDTGRIGITTLLIKDGETVENEHVIPYYSSGNGFVWPEPLWISKWVDKDGNEFDFTKPITEDMELYAVWEGDTDANFLQK